jgi:hypothetical protein
MTTPSWPLPTAKARIKLVLPGQGELPFLGRIGGRRRARTGAGSVDPNDQRRVAVLVDGIVGSPRRPASAEHATTVG